MLGDAKMTTALLDRLTRHCDIVETGTTASASSTAPDPPTPRMRSTAEPSGLFRRGGGPGVAEDGDVLLREAVEVFELNVERGRAMTRSRPGYAFRPPSAPR